MLASPRRLSRLDRILLGIVAALSVVSVAGSELEDRAYYRWRETHPIQMQKQPESRWPAWIRDWKRPVGRRLQAANSGLIAASLGLVVVAFRPGRNGRPRRRGPGHVAIALGGMVAVTLGSQAIQDWINPLFTGQWPFLEPGEPSLAWTNMTSAVYPEITWGIVPAWIYLAATGHWRAPLDPLETLGRWLGWGWIIVVSIQWTFQQIPTW